jgi:hypothetical protein
MAKCRTCGAPVNLAPDGDPRYEKPFVRSPVSLDEIVRSILLQQIQHGTTDYKAGFSSGLQAAITCLRKASDI